MRQLILADIHSNLEALEAVLRAAAGRYDAVLVLGDLVGYGADPNAVVERVQELNPAAAIRGNHDKVVAGLEEADDFNAVAKAAAYWTREILTPAVAAYLKALPKGPAIVDDLVEICHGSPGDEDLYVMADLDAIEALKDARRPVCLFGHTHVALCAKKDDRSHFSVERPAGRPQFEIPLEASSQYLINPGSVGQPRDGDARAAYAIVDSTRRSVTLSRVTYPIEVAQKKILAAGLPPMLAHRLGMGR